MRYEKRYLLSACTKPVFALALVAGVALPTAPAIAAPAASDAPVAAEQVQSVAPGQVLPRSIGQIQPYSWYGGSLSFITSLQGQTRYYDGTNVGIEMTASTYGSGYFEVKLFRDNGWGNSDYIGSSWFNCNGFSKGTWSNVGAGNYYFEFANNESGGWVSSSDVAMYSW